MSTDTQTSAPGPASSDLLVLQDIVVSFDGFRVLDDLSVRITKGELRFLIGPNGAGKTTLMDVISGKIRPASGYATFAGLTGGSVDLTHLREDQIVRKGIGRKFQTPSVFGSLTCFENVEVASSMRHNIFRLLGRATRPQREQILHALERVGLENRRTVRAAELSHGERQWLEIAMLLVQDPRLILLDEPVAGMTGKERERTGEALHALEGAHSLIVTEHDMDFVRQFSRTVTVLHMGRVLKEGPVEEIQGDREVQEVYIGRAKSIAGAA